MSGSLEGLNRINRFLTMLSRVNRTIVRADSPDRLYLDVCNIAVESGLFQLAWIGLMDPITGQFRRIAHCGDIQNPSQAGEALNASAKLVLQGKGTIICNHLGDATQAQAAHRAMQAQGFNSMAGLSLREMNNVIGVCLLYCKDRNAFDEDVCNLLAEVADDISFSLDHMRTEQQRMAAESKLYYLAFYDAQTGLPNRAMLDERLPKLAALASQKEHLLVMTDVRLLRVEQVVQFLGKLALDDVLRGVASRLDSCRGAGGLVVQLAPDEFAMVSHDLCTGAQIEAFAAGLRDALLPAFKSDGRDVYLQFGIGIAAYPLHEPEIASLLRRARAAAEHANWDQGYRLYSADLDRDLEQRVQMLADLHRALERNEFVLHYQPQLNLKTGVIVGVEALLRWQRPQQGMVSPAQFVPLLEDSGLMPMVGAWVLRTACQQAKAWEEAGHPLRMAVNLSAQQFRSADLVATVQNALDDAKLDAEFLELELTESLILESAEQTIAMMHQLKSLGVSLSLDDFGTGYSSLSYLRRYPVDRIKIDQSFVRDMMQHPGSAGLVRSILAMASNLGLKTIAEGVETRGQHGYLRKLMCQEMQGYLFSRPLPAAEVTQLLVSGRKLTTEDSLSHADYTLLIIDDEPRALAAFKHALRQEGWLTLTASTPDEAFDLLATQEVGVVISNQNMPSMTGTDFLHAVKEMYPNTVRILLTGHADFSTVINAVNQGDLYKVLSKPIDDAAMRENIQQAFRRYEVFAENRRLMRRVEILENPAPQLDDTEGGLQP